MIIGGTAPANSGSGVGSAVFPPVDQTTPAPHGVQTPYQPQPHQQHQPGPYGPATPAPTPGYGYPQAPQPYGTHAPLAHQTPPPYTLSHQSSTAVNGGGSKRNMPVVVGSIVVALLAIGGLVAFLNMKDDTDNGKGGDPDTSESTVAGEHKPPERNRTMDTEDCTDATEDTDDPAKVQAPNFVYKDIISAKSCAAAAGWTVKVIEVEGNTYAEDQVIDQFPTSGTAVAERGAHFELRIATGDPA